MDQWATVAAFVLSGIFSVIINSVVLSYFAGKHARRLDDLSQWKREVTPYINKISKEVAYLSGRMNGGSYKHEREEE